MAGSGMCDAGRVRKHLERLLWRREATVLLSGFQAVGTLGRLLQEGRRTVRIQGEVYRVRARIRSLDLYSGHADGPALARWVEARGPVAGEIFLAHGEPDSLGGLRQRLLAAGHAAERIVIPAIDQAFELARASAQASASQRRIEPSAAATLDWHNARSELLNRLDDQLDQAPDDARRMRLIERLEALLAAG